MNMRIIFFVEKLILQIKIHITFINNILFDADVVEGDGGILMIENLLL